MARETTKPEIMAEFAGAIAGMRAACIALDYPVVSGNVSLYNETSGSAIWPTPVIGVARFYARMLAALAEGGFTGTEAVHAFDTLLMFTFGSVLWEIPRTTDVRVRERLIPIALGDEAATQIIERANELSQRDPTEYFEAGLSTILDGLRASRDS